MLTSEADREAAKLALQELVTVLHAKDTSLDAADMIVSCRKILNLWIAVGGSSLDEPVVGFLGIESQTDHVLQKRNGARDVDGVRFAEGSPEEAAEVEDCGRWFLEGFKSDVAALSRWLEAN
jgi:hypothetical protein